MPCSGQAAFVLNARVSATFPPVACRVIAELPSMNVIQLNTTGMTMGRLGLQQWLVQPLVDAYDAMVRASDLGC